MKKILIGSLCLMSISLSAFAIASNEELVIKPVDPITKMSFSKASDVDGVCKLLGFNSAVKNSMKVDVYKKSHEEKWVGPLTSLNYRAYRSSSLVVDSEGRIVKSNEVSGPTHFSS